MESFSEDVVSLLCSFLPSPDLFNLALTCTYLGGRPRSSEVETASSDAKSREGKRRKTGRGRKNVVVKRGGRRWSLIEEAARRRVHKSKCDKWKDPLTRRWGESWISVDHRLFQLTETPLAFDQFIGSGLEYVNNDVSYIRAREKEFGTTRATAMCQKVMRSGKHFAVFTVVFPQEHDYDGWHLRPLKVGVMRPVSQWKRCNTRKKLTKFDPTNNDWWYYVDQSTWNALYPRETKEYFNHCTQHYGAGDEGEDTHCCFYDVAIGTYENGTQVGDIPFGVQVGQGDRLGLLLDLNEGTMTMYKNDRCLGVLKDGLYGEYCWAVTIANRPVSLSDRDVLHEHGKERLYWEESAVSIESAPIPGAVLAID